MKRGSIICWDSCIFIEWLTGDASEMKKSLMRHMEALEEEKIALLASEIIKKEVKSHKMRNDTYGKFQRLPDFSNFSIVSATPEIKERASELQKHFSNNTCEPKGNLSLEDSIHLATAEMVKAEVFYTIDRKNNHGTIGLLPLNGNLPLCEYRIINKLSPLIISEP